MRPLAALSTFLCAMTALTALAGDDPPRPPAADPLSVEDTHAPNGDRRLYIDGLRQAIEFRRRLLTPDARGERIAERLATAMIAFRDQSSAALDGGRPGLDHFRNLDAEEIVARIDGTGRSVRDPRAAFDAFAGPWFGRWESMDVDHHWSRAVVLSPPRTDPALGTHQLLVTQSAWIGDGFGWNVVVHDPETDASFILGTVYHVDDDGDDDRRRVRLHRPHVGLDAGPGRLVWITAGEVFFEEVLSPVADEPERYAITGFRYTLDTEGRVQRQGPAFQAIYSRRADRRTPFFAFPLPTEPHP